MKLDRKIIVVISAVAIAIAVFCGTKHLYTFNKGQDLLEYMKYKMSRPAMPLPNEIKDVREIEFSRITVAGSFVYKHEFLVKQKSAIKGKNSYQVLVPFKRASGQMVMVDRGTVSEDTMGEIVRPKGLIKLEGVVVTPWAEKQLQNDPEKDLWYWPDLDAMAKKAKVNKFLPVIIKSIEKNPYPVSDKIRVEVGVENLNLAAVWYSLAFLVLVILRLNYKKYE